MGRKKRTRLEYPKSCSVFIWSHSNFAYILQKALFLLCRNFVRNKQLVLNLWSISYSRGHFKISLNAILTYSQKLLELSRFLEKYLLDHIEIDISGFGDNSLIWLVDIKFLHWELFEERRLEWGELSDFSVRLILACWLLFSACFWHSNKHHYLTEFSQQEPDIWQSFK